MTENEIIKGNEYCAKIPQCCNECPYAEKVDCVNLMTSDTINLINLKNSKIEKLTETLNATIAGQETLQKALAEKNAEIERLKEYEDIRPAGCSNCNRGNFSNSKFCSHCGTQLRGK